MTSTTYISGVAVAFFANFVFDAVYTCYDFTFLAVVSR